METWFVCMWVFVDYNPTQSISLKKSNFFILKNKTLTWHVTSAPVQLGMPCGIGYLFIMSKGATVEN